MFDVDGPIKLRSEDVVGASDDPQALGIELGELLHLIGADVVQLLHALDTTRDPKAALVRARIWGEQIHERIVPALEAHEALMRAARGRRLLSVVYETADLGVR